jgi:TRAP-type C4-dicarboxylate transport system substrate-binding protein
MEGWLRARIGIAAAVFATAAVAAHAADKLPPTKINVVGNLGITTQYKDLEAPFWTEKIHAASGGAITATIKPWNEMGLKGPEVFRLLRQGLYDIATAQMGHMAGDAPINDATDLAGLSPTIEIFHQVTEAFRPELERYYADDFKAKLLGLWSFQAQVLYCRDQIGGLADLKGKRVRTSGASQSDFIEHFGGSGINMAFGEVQQALANGVIDCAITGTLGGYKAKWHEAAKFLYPMPINWGSSVEGANLAFWKKQSPQVQAFLQEQIKTLEAAVWEQNRRENDLGIACNTGSGPCSEGTPAKMTLVPVSEADLALRKEALLKTVLPRWAKRCGAECAKRWNETVGKIVGLQAPTS